MHIEPKDIIAGALTFALGLITLYVHSRWKQSERDHVKEIAKSGELAGREANLSAENEKLRDGLWKQIDKLGADLERVKATSRADFEKMEAEAGFWRLEHQKRLEELHVVQAELRASLRKEASSTKRIAELTAQVAKLTARLGKVEECQGAPGTVTIKTETHAMQTETVKV